MHKLINFLHSQTVIPVTAQDEEPTNHHGKVYFMRDRVIGRGSVEPVGRITNNSWTVLSSAGVKL